MYRAIQFIGTQRSGSNLLRVMLNESSDIAAPHPPHILKNFYPLLKIYGDLNRQTNFFQLIRDVCEWVNRNPVPWDGIKLNPEDIFLVCQETTLIEVFKRVYERTAAVKGANYWCCKSMENIYYVREIENSGLRPFYIHLFRDGRDVALSFMKTIVGPKHVYHLAKKWLKEQELCLSLKQTIESERFISVRYEELIQNPEEVLHGICSKLGISFTPKMLQYFTSNESKITAKSGTMWSNVAKPIIGDNHHKFLKELTAEEIRIFEYVAGEMLVKLGYSLLTKAEEFKIDLSDILIFDEENRILKERIREMADPEEVARRKPQEELLRTIKERLLV